MSDKKISQLPDGNIDESSIFPIVTSGVTSQTTFSNIIDSLEPYFSGHSSFDVFVTGGTFSAGTAVFTNNTGGTFNVTGFSTGNTDIALFNSHTGNTNNPHHTTFTGLTSTAHTHSISDISGLQNSLDSKINASGGTISGDLSLNSISATTYLNLPLDVMITG